MCVYLFVVLVGLFGVGTARQCENSSTLLRDGTDLGVIDTTTPHCFICPVTPDTILFGGMPFINTTNNFYDPNINTFVISNWTGLNCLYMRITVECGVIIGSITLVRFSGTFFLSTGDFGFRGKVTNVSLVIDVPPILQSCIYGYVYTYLNNFDIYTESVEMIPLSLFENSTQCNGKDCQVTIAPIIIIMRTILTKSQFVVYLNNELHSTTTHQEDIRNVLPACTYETYIGTLVGIVTVVAVVATVSISINIVLILKSKKKHTGSEKPGEITNSEESKNSINAAGNDASVNMVECQAYETVLQPIKSSTKRNSQQDTTSDVIYEAI